VIPSRSNKYNDLPNRVFITEGRFEVVFDGISRIFDTRDDAVGYCELVAGPCTILDRWTNSSWVIN